MNLVSLAHILDHIPDSISNMDTVSPQYSQFQNHREGEMTEPRHFKRDQNIHGFWYPLGSWTESSTYIWEGLYAF